MNRMTIVDALKQTDVDIRLSCGSRWMFWTDVDGWTVLERKPYQKVNRTLYTGENEEMAISKLIGDQDN